MNEKYLSDEFQQEIVEKLSNEIASIIVKQVESAINNADGFRDKSRVEKFDPNTLQPYGKVLAKDGFSSKWTCTFFSHIDNTASFPIYCSGGYFKVCIPYNEETKHLVGTKEDCPEFYKWWEE